MPVPTSLTSPSTEPWTSSARSLTSSAASADRSAPAAFSCTTRSISMTFPLTCSMARACSSAAMTIRPTSLAMWPTFSAARVEQLRVLPADAVGHLVARAEHESYKRLVVVGVEG